jgi:LysM repeat protein
MKPHRLIVNLLLLLPAANLYAQPLILKPNTPDQYVVRPGDTLWGIAERFTESPEQWTEIWQLNKEQIKNPNVLRPGETIFLQPNRARASGIRSGAVTPDRPSPGPATPEKPISSSPSSGGGGMSAGSSSGSSIPKSGSSSSPKIEPTAPWPRPPRRE